MITTQSIEEIGQQTPANKALKKALLIKFLKPLENFGRIISTPQHGVAKLGLIDSIE